jgi:hypothetical protein
MVGVMFSSIIASTKPHLPLTLSVQKDKYVATPNKKDNNKKNSMETLQGNSTTSKKIEVNTLLAATINYRLLYEEKRTA